MVNSLDVVLDYVSQGYPVFPLAVGLKTPATPHGLKDATTDPEKVKTSFEGKNFNVGIRTGEESFIVIDFDSYKHDQSLAALESQYGKLPKTRTVKTCSNGLHLLYKHPGVRVPCSAGKLAQGVDVRGDGGYVVAPPSHVFKNSQGIAGSYELLINAPIAELPEAWVSLLTNKHFTSRQVVNQPNYYSTSGLPTPIQSSLVKDPLFESERNIEKVKEALSFINPDCGYERWFRSLCSIKSLSWKCSDQIAIEWSRGDYFSSSAVSFQLETFYQTYNSISPEGSIGPGTLFHYAKEEGWTNRSEKQLLVVPIDSPEMVEVDLDVRDIKNAKYFAEENRNRFLYIFETNRVLKYDPEIGWTQAPETEVLRVAMNIVRSLHEKCIRLFANDHDSQEAKFLEKHIIYSSSASKIREMIFLAWSLDGMSESILNFDADPNLLGVKNGVLNLSTRTLLDNSPKIRVSKRANTFYLSNAKCAKWLLFLSEIQPDKAMQRLLQQLAGVMLCGNANLQRLVFFFGQGANGKSTFIELISWLLGDYTQRIATELLMQNTRSSQGPSADLAALKGCRLAFCNEVEEGRWLAEARVKELTGGDTITARVPYAKSAITFRPSFTLVMVGNHRPEIHDTSTGMWRRMLLIPFDTIIPEAKRDPNLLEKLKEEGPGILNWALAGYHDYLRHGLRVPKTVTESTRVYRDEQDIIGEWVREHCNVTTGAVYSKSEMYKAYQNWSKTRGQHPLSLGRFSRRLSDRGYKQDAGRRNFVGLELNDDGIIAASWFF